MLKTLKALQTRTHCCGHIVADTNVSPFACTRNICCGHKFCVQDTKNVSDFVQKHFVSATNVSQFVQPKKHHGQQCVRNNVSSFTRALRDNKRAFLTPLKVLQIPLSFLCGSPPGGRTYIYSYFYTLSRPSLVNRDSPALPQVRSLMFLIPVESKKIFLRCQLGELILVM